MVGGNDKVYTRNKESIIHFSQFILEKLRILEENLRLYFGKS